MRIGGLQKLTLIDYPGELAATIFTQGCNFRCHFCYNPLLVVPYKGSKQKNHHTQICEDDLFVFLKKRRDKLDAIVISGGEPTIHKDLPEFIKKIRYLGYKVKLDTNGTNPEMLVNLIKEKLIDYIAMDIKAPIKKYGETINAPIDLSNILKSVKIIMSSNIPYEFRTTVVPKLLKEDDIRAMGKMIKGVSKWYLQKFKPDADLLNKDYKKEKTYTDNELKKLALIGSDYVEVCEVR